MDVLGILRENDIQPTPQRIAVAELGSTSHPTADDVLACVRRVCPTASRATVYNTLNRLVEKGLIRQYILKEGATVFDGHVAPHHHFVEDETGAIQDLPWQALRVAGLEGLTELEVREYQVVVRGRRRPLRDGSLVDGE